MSSYNANRDTDKMDGCCLNVTSEEAISDHDLPKAVGGTTNVYGKYVSITPNEDDVCFCDSGVSDDEATTDDNLPTTVGGVA